MCSKSKWKIVIAIFKHFNDIITPLHNTQSKYLNISLKSKWNILFYLIKILKWISCTLLKSSMIFRHACVYTIFDIIYYGFIIKSVELVWRLMLAWTWCCKYFGTGVVSLKMSLVKSAPIIKDYLDHTEVVFFSYFHCFHVSLG